MTIFAHSDRIWFAEMWKAFQCYWIKRKHERFVNGLKRVKGENHPLGERESGPLRKRRLKVKITKEWKKYIHQLRQAITLIWSSSRASHFAIELKYAHSFLLSSFFFFDRLLFPRNGSSNLGADAVHKSSQKGISFLLAHVTINKLIFSYDL